MASARHRTEVGGRTGVGPIVDSNAKAIAELMLEVAQCFFRIRTVPQIAQMRPATRRQVTSEIQTTAKALARLGALKLSLWCPHCANPHTVRANEAAVQPGKTT